MEGPEQLTHTFKTISLAEMDNVRLMDRTDTKFTFSEGLLPELLKRLAKDYKVLEIGNSRQSSYRTLYFDTDKFKLYLAHHNGHLNRYKVRYRNYSNSDTGFLEVKFKNNKGRTIKDRIKMEGSPTEWNEKALDFMGRKIPLPAAQLKPNVWVNYRRITLVGKNERVTIDTDLEFTCGDKTHKCEGLVIAEVKRAGRDPSPVLTHMKALKIKEVSISKYCLALATVFPQLKRNNFKEKLIQLNKSNKHTYYGLSA